MVDNSILYNTASASILYMKKREYMYLAVEGYVNTATLSDFTKALLEGILFNHVKKILFDTSHLNVIKTEDIHWLKNNLFPIFEKHGVSRVVFIKPENAFGNKSVEMLATAINDKIEAKIFPTMEEAENWLFHN
jgi:hypothetical protein